MTNALIAALVLLAGTASAAPKAAKGKAAEPKATFSVPAACSDVYPKVYSELDPAWSVTVLAPGSADEAVPEPEALDLFIASVPKLEAALAGVEAPERDIFYVRAHTRGLAELKKKYPKIDAGILEAAKLQACRDANAR